MAAEEKGFHGLAGVALFDNAVESVFIHRDFRDFRGKGERPRLEDTHRHRLVRSEDVEGRKATCIPDCERFRTLPDEELQPSFLHRS